PRRLDPPGNCQIAFTNGVRAYVSPAGPGMGFDLVGSAGRLVLLGDGAQSQLWTFGDGGAITAVQNLPFLPPPPAWPLAVEDLFDEIGRATEPIPDLGVARRAPEIGSAAPQPPREGGRRITPAEIDRDLRIASFPWGNE